MSYVSQMGADESRSLPQQRDIQQSGVKRVFTPHTPITDKSLLHSREIEVNRLVDALLTPGLHAVVFGDRGVGKSSLARVVQHDYLSLLTAEKDFSHGCSSSCTFTDIVAGPLAALCGVDVYAKEETSTISGSVEGTVGVTPLSATVAGGSEASVTRSNGVLTAARVATLLSHHEGVLLVDEVDTLQSPEDKLKLAELCKLLSDTNSRFKLVIVGIADAAVDLTNGHPSASRCIREIHLERMTPIGLSDILTNGASQIRDSEGAQRFTFSRSARDAIVSLSNGFPYFAHLLALNAAENAIIDRNDLITDQDLARSLAASAANAEESLRSAYNHAAQSAQTDKYERAIVAASTLTPLRFSKKEWRKAYEKIAGADPAVFDSAVVKLVIDSKKDNPRGMFLREHHGVYRFAEPRMPSFVRILNQIS